MAHIYTHIKDKRDDLSDYETCRDVFKLDGASDIGQKLDSSTSSSHLISTGLQFSKKSQQNVICP